MKKLIWGIATLLFGSQMLYAETITFTTEDFPPFSYVNASQEVDGPSKMIVHAVCRRMKIDCQFDIHPWRRAINITKWGEVNGIFSVSKTAERQEWLYYTDPIVETAYGFFVKENIKDKVKELSDLESYQVTVYGPSNTSRTLEQAAKEVAGLNMHIMLTNELVLKHVRYDRMGDKAAAFINRDVGKYLLKRYGFHDLTYVIDYNKTYYHVGFSKKSTSKEFADKFNVALGELRSSGEMENILSNFGMEVPSP